VDVRDENIFETGRKDLRFIWWRSRSEYWRTQWREVDIRD